MVGKVYALTNADKINLLMKSIDNHIKMGEQAYVVCPLINDNESIDYMDVFICLDLFNYFNNIDYFC